MNGLNLSLEDRTGLALAVLALAVYLVTLTGAPVPGESTTTIVTHLGLDYLQTYLHPLWTLLAHLVAWLPLGTLAGRLNALSALLSTATIWIFFRICLMQHFTTAPSQQPVEGRLLGAVGATGFLAFILPFWVMSNRAHTLSLSMLLLVAAVYFLKRYAATGEKQDLFRWCLTMSLGFVESSTFVVLAVPMFLYAALALYRYRHLKKKIILRALGLGFSGLLIMAIAVLRYRLLPYNEWSGGPGFWTLFWYYCVSQWRLTLGLTGNPGWIIIFLICVLPWIICFSFTSGVFPQTKEKRSAWTRLFLYTVMLLLSLALLYNTRVSPGQFLGFGPMIVSPYLFAASTFGYSINLLYESIYRRMRRRNAYVRHLPRVVTALVMAMLLAGIVVNFSTANTRPARVFSRCADPLVRGEWVRPWLVSNGTLDGIALVKAYDQGLPLHILRMESESSLAYRNYLVSLFEKPRLKSLARLGAYVLVKDWMRIDPAITEKLSNQYSIRIWQEGKRRPVPYVVTYLGATGKDIIDGPQLMEEHRAVWSDVVEPLRKIANQKGYFTGLASALLVDMSMVADDLGVLMERNIRPQLAEEAYRMSILLEPANPMAHLNLTMLLEEKVGEEVGRLLAGEKGRFSLPWLIDNYGRIHRRESVDRLADLWDIKAPQGNTADRKSLRSMIKKMGSGNKDEVRATLRERVEKDPDDVFGWTMLALFADRERDQALMDECVNRMKARQGKWPVLLTLLGRQQLREGNRDAAMAYLNDALKANPGHMRALELTLPIYLERGDFTKAEAVVRRILEMDPGNALGNFGLGTMHYRNDEMQEAEVALRRSIRRRPLGIALNNLAWIMHEQGRNEEALSYVEQALKLRGPLYSNLDTMGVVLTSLDRYREAEAAFDSALETNPDGVDVKLHKAELMMLMEKPEEAKSIIDQFEDRGIKLPTDKRKKLEDLIRGLR